MEQSTDRLIIQPQAIPELVSLGRSEVKEFLDEFEKTNRALKVRGGDEVPLLACVQYKLLIRLCKYNLDGQDVKRVTSDQIKSVLDEILQSPVSRTVDLRGLLKEKLVFDLSIKDPCERVSLLFGTLDRLLDEEAGGLDLPEEERCKFILKALRPPAIRRLAENKVNYESRGAKSSSAQLFKVLWKEVPEWERCLRIAGLFNHAIKEDPSDGDDDAAVRPTTGGNGEAAPGKRYYPCLKCHSRRHKLVDCPDASTEEKSSLLKEYQESKGKGVRTRARGGDSKTPEVVGRLALSDVVRSYGSDGMRSMRVRIGGFERQAVLDSGSQVNVLPAMFVDYMEEHGVPLTIQRAGREGLGGRKDWYDLCLRFVNGARVRCSRIVKSMPVVLLTVPNSDDVNASRHDWIERGDPITTDWVILDGGD
eukprot:Rmarinus@m.2197